MNIHLEYSMNLDDFYDFQMAYRKNRKSLTRGIKRRFWSTTLILWLFVIVTVLWMCVISAIFSPDPPAAPAPAPVSLGESLLALLRYFYIMLIAWLFLFFLPRWKLRYRGAFDEFQKYAELHATDLTDSQITIRQRGCVSVMEWSWFIACIETKSNFMLFSSARLGHTLPKRAFPSEEAMSEFRTFAQAHIGNQPMGFPVQPAKLVAATPVQMDKEPS